MAGQALRPLRDIHHDRAARRRPQLALVTAGYARLQAWPADIPPWVAAGGLVATLLIGRLAALYPATRAADVAPTEALDAA